MTLARTTDRIESPRLLLRRIEPADLPFVTRIHAAADVARYIGHVDGEVEVLGRTLVVHAWPM